MFKSKKKVYFQNNQTDTSIVLFFASILCRLAYEPPNYYQLFLLKILRLFNKKELTPAPAAYIEERPHPGAALTTTENALQYLYKTLREAKKTKTQDEFVKVLLESIIKDLNEDNLAEEINEMTATAISRDTRKVAAQARGEGEKIESYLTTQGFSDDDKKIFEEIDDRDLYNIGEIKTIYLQSSDELNVYVTAFAELNSIFVTFRGSSSFKNIVTDLKFARSKKGSGSSNCSQDEQDAFKNQFSSKTGYLLDRHLPQQGGQYFDDDISFFRGVTSLLDTSIHTLTNTVIYLARWLFERTKKPAQVFTFGHSLGGGLATLYSYKYPKIYDHIKGHHDGEVNEVSEILKPGIIGISNAAPRILSKGAEYEFHNMMVDNKIKFIRQWTDGDLITTLPPEVLGFLHPKQWKEGEHYGMVKTVKHNNRLPTRTKLTASGPLDSKWRGPGKSWGAVTGHGLMSHSHQTKINFLSVFKRFTGAHSTGTVKKEGISRDNKDKKVKEELKSITKFLTELQSNRQQSPCEKEHIALLKSMIKELKNPKDITILLAEMKKLGTLPVAQSSIIYTKQALQKQRYQEQNPFTGHKTDIAIKDYKTFLTTFIGTMKPKSAAAAGGKRITKQYKKHKFRTTRKRHKRHNLHKKRNTRKRHKRRKSLRKKTRKH